MMSERAVAGERASERASEGGGAKREGSGEETAICLARPRCCRLVWWVWPGEGVVRRRWLPVCAESQPDRGNVSVCVCVCVCVCHSRPRKLAISSLTPVGFCHAFIVADRPGTDERLDTAPWALGGAGGAGEEG